VKQKYGIPAKRIIDFKALAGDASDNIKGVNGIGPKGAVALIQQYGPVETIVKKVDKLKPYAKAALLAKEIVTMRTDVPLTLDLERAAVDQFNWQATRAKFAALGFSSLIKRLPHTKQPALL
ncbi:DNA polymerase I, partial [Candidatus Berkelbacteria bacterium]|nr:DNA polymerase I [Candidatus Berkelbacteria bacterium]